MKLIDLEKLKDGISNLPHVNKDSYEFIYAYDLNQELESAPIISSGLSKKDIFVCDLLHFLDGRAGYASLDANPEAAEAYRDVTEYIKSLLNGDVYYE